jgi:3-dehydroquinate synthase
LWNETGKRIGLLAASKVLVVSNRKVHGLYGPALEQSLVNVGIKYQKILIPDGEPFKILATVEKILDRLVGGGFDRDAIVIALGGGVIGDIAGFAAAAYMRGIRVVQIPTTLLSQVDSSVGGKTGVNHPKGKNLIGAFHQPSLVIADVVTLKTLPTDEVLCGVAEVIKYGCISSKQFFLYLEKNIGQLVSLDPVVTAKTVNTSCQIKAAVVASDEREAGLRATLNFGHTVGHALEAVTGYKRYKHGHAVAIGMRAAAELSQLKGRIDEKEKERIKNLIEVAGLPVQIPESLTTDALMAAMGQDKKVSRGVIRFVLLDGIGSCSVVDDVSVKEIAESIRLSR